MVLTIYSYIMINHENIVYTLLLMMFILSLQTFMQLVNVIVLWS